MECRCCPYRPSDLNRQIELAWQYHCSGDFDQADQIFQNMKAFDGSVRTSTEFGRSLRYRGDFQQAVSILESAWEDAKLQNCDTCQIRGLTELLVCLHQTGDSLRFSQISQLFYGLCFNEPNLEQTGEVLSLLLAWNAWESGELDTAKAHSQLVASHENQRLCINSQTLLVEIEWLNGQARESQLRLFRCCEFAMVAGDFYGALTLAEKYSQRELERRHWAKALRGLRLLSQISDRLGLQEKHRQSLRWQNRIEQALSIGELDVLQN